MPRAFWVDFGCDLVLVGCFMVLSCAVTEFSYRGEPMTKVYCPACNEPAPVYSRAAKADTVDALYCRCVNSECEKHTHTFVALQSFSHWVEPRASALQLNMMHLFEQLPASDKADMLQQLQASARA